MTRERPVIELIDLEIFDGSEWARWTDPLRSINIRRGGKRKGLTQSVDVGTLSCEFVNAGDPLVNESTVPAEVVFYDGFASGVEGWSGGAWDDAGGATTLNTTFADAATTTIGGLQPGRTYTIRAFRSGAACRVEVDQVQTYSEATTRFATYADAQAAAAGLSYEGFEQTHANKALASAPVVNESFSLLEMKFTAVWSHHEIRLSTYVENAGYGFGPYGEGPYGEFVLEDDPGATRWDRVQIVRDAYTVATPQLKPNQRVRLQAGEQTVWAGTTEDIASAYTLDKDTGRTTAHVSLAAVDAVSAIAGVTRYGAVVEGGARSETWPSRINRLALSAPAGVAVEHVDEATDIVRYALG